MVESEACGCLLNEQALWVGKACERWENEPKIENARGRSPWRLNLDESVVQPDVASSSYPSGEAPAFTGSCILWLRRNRTFDLRRLPCTPARPGANFSGSDRRSFVRLARWQAFGFRRLLRASDRSAADFPACAGAHPLTRPTINFRLTPGVYPSARLVSVNRLSPLAVATLACAFCCCDLQLALPAARLPNRWRTSDSHRLFSSAGFTGFDLLSLRRASLSPAGPLMHPLLQPNVASRAEPSMSFQYPPDLASSGSASLTTSDLRRLLQSLARPAIPLWLSPQVSPSGWAGGDCPTLIGFSFHRPFRRSTPDALLAIS